MNAIYNLKRLESDFSDAGKEKLKFLPMYVAAQSSFLKAIILKVDGNQQLAYEQLNS